MRGRRREAVEVCHGWQTEGVVETDPSGRRAQKSVRDAAERDLEPSSHSRPLKFASRHTDLYYAGGSPLEIELSSPQTG